MESNDGKDPVGIYLQQMASFPLLSREEEKELARRAKNGDEEARNKLIKANLRLVVWKAKQYLGYLDGKLTFLDLIQEGNLGLFEAFKRFDPEMDTKFSSYALDWVRLAITRALCNQRTIRISTFTLEQLNFLKKTSTCYLQERGRWPTTEELAQETDMPVEKVKKILQLPQVATSLEKPVRKDKSGNPTVIADFILDENTINPEEVIQGKELEKRTIEALSSIRPREEKVLRMYLGIGEKRKYTLQEIGDEFQFTRERARQIKKKALEKLRHPKRKRLLEGFLE